MSKFSAADFRGSVVSIADGEHGVRVLVGERFVTVYATQHALYVSDDRGKVVHMTARRAPLARARAPADAPAPRQPRCNEIVSYHEGDNEAPYDEGYANDVQRRLWPGTDGTRWHPAIITAVHTDEYLNLLVLFDGVASQSRGSMHYLADEVFAEHCTVSGWAWEPRD